MADVHSDGAAGAGELSSSNPTLTTTDSEDAAAPIILATSEPEGAVAEAVALTTVSQSSDQHVVNTADTTSAAAAAASSVENLTASIATAQIAPSSEDAGASVRRQHVEALQEESKAEVTVHAPGYEHMLSSARWEDLPLPPDIIRGVYAKGWERPSKIQAQALPYMLRRDHPSLLAQAKNGSGKTGAFGLAMLAAVDVNLNKVQALCMSPTRELAIQTTRVLQQLSQFTNIQSVSVIGGVRYTQEISSHIVVATPGKIQDVLKTRKLDLSALRVFVLDEADDMIENFAGDCMFVKRASCKGRQPPQVCLCGCDSDVGC